MSAEMTLTATRLEATRPRLNIDVFTIGAVAKLLCVAPRTVSRWVDKGLMRGYVVPGSLDRRVLLGDLRAFVAETGIPFVVPLPRQLLTVGLCDHLARALQSETDTAGAQSLLDLGLLIDQRSARHVVVLDLGAIGRGEGMMAARCLRSRLPDARLIALAGEDEGRVPELAAAGFGWVLLSPIPEKVLRQAVAAAMEE